MFVSSLAEIGSGKEMDKQKEVGINDIVTFVLINWAPYAKYERLKFFFSLQNYEPDIGSEKDKECVIINYNWLKISNLI